MTTLDGRDKTALVVVDVQNEVVGEAYDRDAVVARITGLLGRAREQGVPVVWVQHSDEGLAVGSDDWQIVPELVPTEGEARVRKEYGDAFEGTDLEQVLAGLDVGRLYIAGAETDACIRSTIHGAFARGLRHDPRRRRAHQQRQVPVGRTVAGRGDRPHEPVLGLPGSPRQDRRCRGCRGRRLRVTYRLLRPGGGGRTPRLGG